MGKIKNIVLDMGNVLMTFDGRAFSKAFTDTPEDADLLFYALFGRAEWALLDSGTISEETMLRVARAKLPERLHANLYACMEGWIRFSQPIESVNELALRLHEEGYRLFVLSNASKRIEEQLGNAPVRPVLEGVVVSSKERLMKPDPAIYELLCERYGLVPSECLFVDDNADNCEGARVADMEAFHFTGDAAALEQAIRQAG